MAKSYTPEVLLASWIPLPPQLPASPAEARPADPAADTGAFLARVYTNQEC